MGMEPKQYDAAVEANQATVPTVFSNRNFIYLFIGAMFSGPGYYIYLIGAEWLMLHITEQRFYLGMLFMAAAIPRLVFMLYGGVIADRVNKRTILFFSDLSRALLVFTVLILVVTDAVQVWHLIVISIFFGISDAFSHPALNSLIVDILPKDLLQRGNGILQMSNQISPILGPAAGGTLIVTLGFKGIFLTATLLLLVAAWTVYQIKLEKQEKEAEVKPIWNELKEGFAYVKTNRLLLSVMGLAFFLNFFINGPLAMGIPILVKDVLKENALGLTVLEVSIGIGALVGAGLMTLFKKLKRPGLVVLVSLLIQTISFALLGLIESLYVGAVLLFITGMLIQVVNIPIFTAIQAKTDPAMLGRVLSMLMTTATGLVPISFLVTSLLVGAGIPISTIIVVSGLAVFIVSVLGFGLRELRTFTYD